MKKLPLQVNSFKTYVERAKLKDMPSDMVKFLKFAAWNKFNGIRVEAYFITSNSGKLGIFDIALHDSIGIGIAAARSLIGGPYTTKQVYGFERDVWEDIASKLFGKKLYETSVEEVRFRGAYKGSGFQLLDINKSIVKQYQNLFSAYGMQMANGIKTTQHVNHILYDEESLQELKPPLYVHISGDMLGITSEALNESAKSEGINSFALNNMMNKKRIEYVGEILERTYFLKEVNGKSEVEMNYISNVTYIPGEKNVLIAVPTMVMASFPLMKKDRLELLYERSKAIIDFVESKGYEANLRFIGHKKADPVIEIKVPVERYLSEKKIDFSKLTKLIRK